MKRLAVMLFAGALAACGGQDSGSEKTLPSIDAATEAASDASAAAGNAAKSAKSARDSAAAAAKSASETVTDLAETNPGDGQSATCLQLVAEAEFAQAIPVCTAALAANPTSQQLKDALATAQAEAGTVADAAAAAADAAKQRAATDAAGGLLGK